jgi:outer membrane protein assembly factor BamA
MIPASPVPYQLARPTERRISGFLKLSSAAALLLMALSLQLFAHTDSLNTGLLAPGSFPDSVFTVSGIRITGNEHTKEFVITREMTLQPGRRVTNELLRYDQNRIMSLGLFNEVKLAIAPRADSAGMADIVAGVNERWYIFPYPVFGIKDRDWSKIYYGVGLLNFNFRGQNEKLNTALVLGYDPAVMLSFRTPYLGGSGDYFLETRFASSSVTNRSVMAEDGLPNFDERHIAASISVGERFGITQTAWLTAGFEHVHISDFLPGRTLSGSGNDDYPILSAGYQYDSRDLNEYPSHGTFLRFAVTKFGFPGGGTDIVRYAADIRRFIPLGGGFTLAGRCFTDIAAAGPTPSYNHVYFGYGERIRGHYGDVFEGESLTGTSAELRMNLLPVRYLEVPILPRQFALWRFGVAAALFGDAGTTWFRGEPYALNRWNAGYGIGLDFLLPYSAILRTEYGLNENRKGQFIIDLGALL